LWDGNEVAAISKPSPTVKERRSFQAKSTEHKARREIYQCLTGVAGRDNLAVPSVKVSEIDLHLRTKVFADFVLKGVIPV
jgi:hypothetical protein